LYSTAVKLTRKMSSGVSVAFTVKSDSNVGARE
jgi:hypothetical protein